MKNKIIFVYFFILSTVIVGQNIKQSTTEFMLNFEKYYNASQYNRIYNFFTSGFQNKVSKEKYLSIMNTLKKENGDLLSYEMIYNDNEKVRFNVHFENGHKRFKLYPDTEVLNKMKGFLFRDNPFLKRNKSKLILPFKDAWTVIVGGETKEQQLGHAKHNAQKFGYDFVLFENKKAYKTNGKTNQDYYSFGKDIIAPVAAEVVMVVNGVPDNEVGRKNMMFIPGNMVMLKTTNEEYIILAHLKLNSIKVKVGDKVIQGQVLGQCGNSGNSSIPHLHFHMQNIKSITAADGIKCYFDAIIVNETLKKNHFPIRRETLKN